MRTWSSPVTREHGGAAPRRRSAAPGNLGNALAVDDD
jgi:hypothetical protein